MISLYYRKQRRLPIIKFYLLGLKYKWQKVIGTMEDLRSFRNKGDLLILGHTKYRILDIAGFGGSSVVYQAVYADQLNAENWHQVLIKELYPFHPKGYIYRDTNGFIQCLPEAKEQMDCNKLRFKQGNQVNLELLEKIPSQTSGNLNSYEAYGTYYSILTVHGGQTLEELMENKKVQTLQTSVELTIKILDALELFHENRLLHLDISPDNIILLPEQAMLIDYNSTWNMDSNLYTDFTFSVKEGYSAPEIYFQDFSQIGYATDLYSVCAIFCQMLTGTKLSKEAVTVTTLKKLFSDNCEIFQREPQSAVHKTMEILYKGLHVLGRKRYQTINSFRDDLDEVLNRIFQKGVSHSAIWESSRSLCKKSLSSERYLPQEISLVNGETAGLEDIYIQLKDGKNLLLTGPGGMGKTRLLQELWKNAVKEYHPKRPVVYYIPLKDYQQMPEEKEYIHKYVIRHLSFSDKQKGIADALRELEHIFCTCIKNNVSIVLLLDGLNEAGSRCGNLLKEIEYLASLEGISILVTERFNEVHEYGLSSFHAAQLLPLKESVVEDRLVEFELSMPSKQDIRELLCNPMMLHLYLEMADISKEVSPKQPALQEIHSTQNLVASYFDHLLLHQIRLDSGDKAAQLCHRYILQHLLPEIAGEMKRKNHSLLTFDELYLVVKRNFANLRLPEFGKSFDFYLGKARFMLVGIADESQWFDFAVTETLIGNLNLIVKGENGYFGLLHDNFQDYLLEVWERNRSIYRKQKLRLWKPKLLTIFLIVFMGIAGIFTLYQQNKSIEILDFNQRSKPHQEPRYTEEEQQVIDRVAICLETNLAALSAQIMAQRDILEQASKSGILEPIPKELEDLRQFIVYKTTMTNTFPILSLHPKLIEQLIEINPEIPISYLQDLCSKPSQMSFIMENALLQLDEMLCDYDSIYQDREIRKEIVEAYQLYLDAYTEYVFYEFDYVLMYMAPDEMITILNENRYSPIFQDYFKITGISKQDTDIVKTAMDYSADKLKNAQQKMTLHHFKIDWQ